MNIEFKVILFEILLILSCCSSESIPSVIGNNQHKNIPEAIRHRFKRGHGGIIPFRPLFVYRQQQKELQEKRKLKEKLINEQQLQYQRDYQLHSKTASISSLPLNPTYQRYSEYQRYPTYPTYKEYISYRDNYDRVYDPDYYYYSS